jgi:nucleotide-binding universal stress UspA family protein
MSGSTSQPVVVGVDASEAALRAVRFGAEEARLRGAALRLVHAVPKGSVRTPNWLGEPDVPTLVRNSAQGIVEWAASAASSDGVPGDVSTAVVEGEPLDTLREESRSAQLLVVGSRGVGGLAGLFLGSTAAGIAGHAHGPVVVLPDVTTVSVEPRRSVVVGIEGGVQDEPVLSFAFAEAARRRTDLVAVHAWQDVVLETAFRSVGPLVDWAELQAEQQRVLSETLAGWAEKEPDVVVREVVLREKPAAALVAAAMSAELLVVGHHARRAMGSTTHGVLHRATCPVAIVPLPARTDR